MTGLARFYLRKARAQLAGWESERGLERRFPTLWVSRGVQIVSSPRLDVGRNVLIQQGAILHCGGLDWSGGEGHIRIGSGSVISPYCVLYGAGGIEIGERFDCGPGSMIFSSRTLHGRAKERQGGHLFARVVIGDDVTLYAGCILTPGVTIGDGAALAAGSVVLEDVPPGTLYGGTPARKIRDID